MENRIKPAEDQQILSLLARLRVHYPIIRKSEKEIELLFADFLSDLSHLPADIIELSCSMYRRCSKNQYFPKVGQLLEPAERMLWIRRHKLTKLQKLLAASV